MDFKKTTIRKILDDEIKRGELVRIRATGEVFIYGSSEYRVNFCSGITTNRDVYIGVFNLNQLQIVNLDGSIIKEWLTDS